MTFPYLVRVLGTENIGLLGFSTAVITYLALFTDYGFNISATRKIVNNRSNQMLVNEVFSTVLVVKLVLMLISFLVLLLLITIFDKIGEYWILYIVTFGIVVGQVLFPVWLYQGLEEMKYIAYINLFSRLIFTLCVFVFVNNESDILLVPLFTSLGTIFSGVLALYFAKQLFGVKLVLPGVMLIKQEIKEGWHIFTSTVAINTYKTNSIIVLGVFSTELIVGYFMVAKKVFEALNGLNAIISQAFLPYVIRTKKKRNGISKELVSLVKVCFIVSSLMLVFTWGLSSIIISLVAGEEVLQSTYALQYFAVALFFIGINVPAVIYLLQDSYDKKFSNAVSIGALVDMFLLLVLVPMYNLVGALIVIVLTELLVTFLLYYFSYKVYQNAKKRKFME
jgi:PST family polysaccharide transporter